MQWRASPLLEMTNVTIQSSANDSDDLYSDDEAHPIPRIGVIDVETRLKSGGAYYGLVIASPLTADERSQKRLIQKIQHYIEDFHSEKSRQRMGSPDPEKARIYIVIHPDSAPEIFTLLEQCRSWVEENRIMFSVSTDLGPPSSGEQ